jgi:phospholipase C
MRKLKTTLLSTAAIFAVAVAVTSTAPVAAQGILTGLGPLFNFIDQLIGDIQTPSQVNALPTKSPIKHLVVIFQENRSFDHYFGTYPKALNPAGEPAFTAAKNTPIPNNYVSNPTLLTANPNFTNSGAAPTGNGANAANPFRLDRTQANTASENHNYTPEQLAFDHGKLDLVPLEVGSDSISGTTNTTAASWLACLQYPGPDDGLFRRQHRHRILELRPEFRNERQFLGRYLWSVDPRRARNVLGQYQRRCS